MKIDPHIAVPDRLRGPALALYAVILGAFFAASSAPTPLYHLYQLRWHFSSGALTFVFASYAFSLLLALLTTGPLSDYLGRRPVMLAALALEGVSMGVFISANGVGALIAARLIQGFATGIAASVVSAAILDVDRTRGPLTNSMTPLVGMALGALISSALVQYAPHPMRLAFIALLTVFALQFVGVLAMPETVRRRVGALASMRLRVVVPVAARPAMWLVAPIDIAVWALGGFYLSLGPTLARTVTGSNAIMVGGWLVFALTGGGIVAIWTLRRLSGGPLLQIGGWTLASGLIVTLAGVHANSASIFFGGTMLAGVGFGTGFQGAMRSVMPLAGADERAGLMAAFYILSYLAFSIPAISAGMTAPHIGLRMTTDVYALTLIGLVALTLISSARAARRRLV